MTLPGSRPADEIAAILAAAALARIDGRPRAVYKLTIDGRTTYPILPAGSLARPAGSTLRHIATPPAKETDYDLR